MPSLEWRGALETLLATVVEQPDIQLSQVAEILDEAENNSKYSKPRVQTAPPEIRQDRRQPLASMNSHYKRQIIHDN